MDAVAIIPARLASTRLARKALRELAGRPMVGWVYEAALKSNLLREVIIATDANEIMEICGRHGWNAALTSPLHRSGTERVHEISQRIGADVYINIQGDEPLTRPEHVQALLSVMEDSSVQVGTVKTMCSPDDIENPNAVKVVTDHAGRALYFSRAAIPFDRDAGPFSRDANSINRNGTQTRYYKHLGLYVYRKPALDRFVALPESELEKAERLEQLRFLQNGIDIAVAETPFDTIGVDTEEDLRRVEKLLSLRHG